MDKIDLISEIIYVETTFVGIAGAFLCHMMFWFIMFEYDQPYGVAGKIRDFLRTTKRYKTTIPENMKVDKATLRMYGIEEEPGMLFVMNIMTCLHHGTGGALILAGILTNRPFLVRHGMMTEAGGMDMLFFLKMVICQFFKPGPWPERTYDISISIGTSLHHSVALTAVVPIIFYFSEDPKFQQLALVLLGGPMTYMIPDILVSALYGAEYKNLHVCSKVISFANFVCQRVVYFFPVAYSITKVVSSSEIPSWSKYALYYSCFAMSLVNLLFASFGLVFMVATVKMTLATTGSDAEKELRRFSQTSFRSSQSIPLMVTFISDEIKRNRNLTNFFVASRIIAKAKHAKKVVKEKDNKKQN